MGDYQNKINNKYVMGMAESLQQDLDEISSQDEYNSKKKGKKNVFIPLQKDNKMSQYQVQAASNYNFDQHHSQRNNVLSDQEDPQSFKDRLSLMKEGKKIFSHAAKNDQFIVSKVELENNKKQ